MIGRPLNRRLVTGSATRRGSIEYKAESVLLDVTEQIADCMVAKNLNRAQPARLLGVSPPMVTRILNGAANFTLRSLVNIGDVPGCDLSAKLVPAGSAGPRSKWTGQDAS